MALADKTLTSVVDPDGRAVITVVVDGRQRWTVSQISPELPGAPGEATGQVRKNGSLVAPFEPGGDAIGGEPPVVIGIGDSLTIEWTNCEPGTTARAFIMFDDGVVVQ